MSLRSNALDISGEAGKQVKLSNPAARSTTGRALRPDEDVACATEES